MKIAQVVFTLESCTRGTISAILAPQSPSGHAALDNGLLSNDLVLLDEHRLLCCSDGRVVCIRLPKESNVLYSKSGFGCRQLSIIMYGVRRT